MELNREIKAHRIFALIVLVLGALLAFLESHRPELFFLLFVAVFIFSLRDLLDHFTKGKLPDHYNERMMKHSYIAIRNAYVALTMVIAVVIIYAEATGTTKALSLEALAVMLCGALMVQLGSHIYHRKRRHT